MTKMASFTENLASVQNALKGLPERRTQWQREAAMRDLLTAAKNFAANVEDPGKVDIAEELGLTDAFHAIPTLPDIPAVSPEPRLSPEVLEQAQKVRDALKVAEMLELSESDIEDAKGVLAQVDQFRPAPPKVGRTGTKSTKGTDGTFFADITMTDGTAVSRKSTGRADSLRYGVREVIGDAGTDESGNRVQGDNGFRDGLTAAFAAAVDNPGTEHEVTHPNGSSVRISYEAA